MDNPINYTFIDNLRNLSQDELSCQILWHGFNSSSFMQIFSTSENKCLCMLLGVKTTAAEPDYEDGRILIAVWLYVSALCSSYL